MTEIVLQQKTIGFRNVLNTQWPREAYLSADFSDGLDGFVVEVICNGISDRRKPFRSLAEEERDFKSLGDPVG